MLFNDDKIAITKKPIYLDNDSEMIVGHVFINYEFWNDFNNRTPMRSHYVDCPKHGSELSHYSIQNSGKPRIKLGAEAEG